MGLTLTVRNIAHKYMLTTPKGETREIPFLITGLDFDNRSEFPNQYVIEWAESRGIYMTRSRPYKKIDQVTIESQNSHVVRRYGFYYLFDTDVEQRALNRIWHLVNDHLNHLVRTIKLIRYSSTRTERRKRVYNDRWAPSDRYP